MTGQFYKNPQRVFRSISIFRSRKPLGGFFVLLGRRQSGIPTSGLRFALRGSADHAFFLLAGNYLAFPKYMPPCSIKHLVSPTLLERSKGSRTGGRSGGNCQGNELAPFVYIGFPHILNQISWLTVQQGADCIKGFPRH